MVVEVFGALLSTIMSQLPQGVEYGRIDYLNGNKYHDTQLNVVYLFKNIFPQRHFFIDDHTAVIRVNQSEIDYVFQNVQALFFVFSFAGIDTLQMSDVRSIGNDTQQRLRSLSEMIASDNFAVLSNVEMLRNAIEYYGSIENDNTAEENDHQQTFFDLFKEYFVVMILILIF